MHNIPLSRSLSTVHLGASEGGNVARREPMFLSFPRERAFSVPFVHQQPSCLTHEENTSALSGKIKGGRGAKVMAQSMYGLKTSCLTSTPPLLAFLQKSTYYRSTTLDGV